VHALHFLTLVTVSPSFVISKLIISGNCKLAYTLSATDLKAVDYGYYFHFGDAKGVVMALPNQISIDRDQN
jgi:hypothetical protein